MVLIFSKINIFKTLDMLDKKELLDAVIDFEEKAHPKGDAKKYFRCNFEYKITLFSD